MSSASQVLHIECLSSSEGLRLVRDVWEEELRANQPFLTFGWLDEWWKSYSANHSLYLLIGYQESNVRLVAPWYLHNSLARGKEIRFLGSGDACSDHMTLIQHPQNTKEVTRLAIEGLAEFVSTDRGWDMINLDGVSEADNAIGYFGDCLLRRDVEVRSESEISTWRLDLPDTWDAYIAKCNKKIRQKLRRVLRDAERHQVRFHFCDDPGTLDQYYDTLVDLHIRRRFQLEGDQGCFDTEEFEEFLRSAAKQFHTNNQLWLGQVDVGGVPAASCLAFQANKTLYFYQSGFNPRFSKLQPGWLLNAKLIQTAIQRGLRAIDYLRGDEKYKARLSATPTQQRRILAVANHVTSKTRDRLWQTARRIKQLVHD